MTRASASQHDNSGASQEIHETRTQRKSMKRCTIHPLIISGAAVLCFLSQVVPAQASWGWSSNEDPTIFGDSFNRDWMYDASALSLKIEGCVWSVVEPEDEDMGCMEQDSEDGTTYWYQMSNCKRAQVAFSLYASDSGSSVGCNSNSYKETFVTKYGLAEFLYYLSSYDTNNPFGGSGNADDDGGAYDDGYGDGRFLEGDDDSYGGYGLDDLPVCDGDNGYMGVGCASDGTFTIDYFNDAYCMQSSGTYDSLSNLNSLLKHYRKCGKVYNGNGNSYLAQQLVPYCESCSSLDSPLCKDDSSMSDRRSRQGGLVSSTRSGWMHSAASQSWATKVKYGTGCLLLLASFVMFTGILFTNRRRRRALMQRKFRQSSRRRKKSRSKSRHRDESRGHREENKSRRSSKSRSKSRSKRPETEEDTGGVYT